MRIFVISPVRNITEEQKVFLHRYIQELSWKNGHVVHFPLRDTKQDDPAGGINICRTNFLAMLRADEIHVFYDSNSEGFVFDLGMLFALLELTSKYRIFRWIIGRKKIVLINPGAVGDQIKEERDRGVKKSFARVLFGLAMDFV